MRPILNGSAESIHRADEAIGSGPWVALRPGSDPTGKWQLYSIVNYPAQNNNLVEHCPDMLKQMMNDYQKYAEEVGDVIPTDKKTEIQYSKVYLPPNQTQTRSSNHLNVPMLRI